MNRVFQKTGSLRPGRSVFDLSYSKMVSADMGLLIPCMADEVVPGDVFDIGNKVVIRFNPMVAPVMHEIDAFVHYFYVPYRLLWSSWEDFITGGSDGTYSATLPRWSPSSTAEGSLWDYFGFPTGVTPNANHQPMDFPKRAYNMIYNEYYRVQDLIAEVNIETSEAVHKRAWEKDYFTSSTPWAQRGTAPALPISGSSAAVFSADVALGWPAVSGANQVSMQVNSSNKQPFDTNTKSGLELGKALKTGLDNNTVSLASATTFSINDLRLAVQIQAWMERNARAGARYQEFLQSHFGVSARDERLDRPEYLGGTRAPIIVSEVVQNSETGTTPQGTLAGHGITAAQSFAAHFRVPEFGVIIGVFSVMPRPMYQQGIDRQWLRRTKYDFYFPEFAALGEQGIERAEIYTNTVQGDNATIFGYQGRYDEMRTKRNMVTGPLRTTLDHWHLARQFGSAPLLNQSFVECVPRKDFLAAPSSPTFVATIGNLIKAVRPMPASGEPAAIA